MRQKKYYIRCLSQIPLRKRQQSQSHLLLKYNVPSQVFPSQVFPVTSPLTLDNSVSLAIEIYLIVLAKSSYALFNFGISLRRLTLLTRASFLGDFGHVLRTRLGALIDIVVTSRALACMAIKLCEQSVE